MKKMLFVLGIGVFMSSLNGCSQLKQIQDALANLAKLQFKLNNVNTFKLLGIDVSSKQSLSDFNPLSDGLRLLSAYTDKKFPATFVLNVDVKNPNTGSNGTKAVPATLTGLDFRLIIDNVPTITGEIGKEFAVPANNTSIIVPVDIGLDLYEFFGKNGYEKIVDMALAIGGKSGSASRITLDAKPTVRTDYGPITYPGRLNIVDKQFTNQ